MQHFIRIHANYIRLLHSKGHGFCTHNKNSLNELMKAFQKDIKTGQSQVRLLQSKFFNLIQQNISVEQRKCVIKLLKVMQEYHWLNLSKKQRQSLNVALGKQMQLLSEQQLNVWFQFTLKYYQNPKITPVYIQFLRHYLKDSNQLLLANLGLNIKQATVLQSIKALFAFILFKVHLPRFLSYQRELNIIRPVHMLNLLVNNSATSSSLIVRKIFFPLFLQIKFFYNTDMHQNLYHYKRSNLFSLLKSIVKVISSKNPHIEIQNQYLRELFVKMYLTSVFQVNNPILIRQQFNKIIYIYLLHQQFKQQKNQLFDQFCEQFEKSIEQLQKKLSEKNILFQQMYEQLSVEESLLMVSRMRRQIKCEQICYKLKQKLKKLSPSQFKLHLNEIIKIIPRMSAIKVKQTAFDLLNIEDLAKISEWHQSFQDSQVVLNQISNKIMEYDESSLSGQQVYALISFTKIVFHSQIQNIDTTPIRVFVLRYVADQHRTFSWSSYHQIINAFCHHQFLHVSFDDQDQNYSNNIFTQLKSYNNQNIHKFNEQFKKQLLIHNSIDDIQSIK